MLNELYQRISRFYPEEKLVFCDGTVKNGLLLIGEAPGKDEVVQGRPFVGKAGKNLDEFLDVLGLLREEICITNVCKFRPTKISPKGSTSNRTPTRTEVMQALPFLQEEINLIAPQVIVTLGNTPLRAVLGDFSATIGEYHGKATKVDDRDLFALYHPASIIYNRALKEVYYQDLQLLKDYLSKIEMNRC